MKKKETYFETIRCEDFEVFNIAYHKKRVSNTIGLNIDLNEFIYPPNDKLLKCKVVYNQDGIVDISYTPYTPKQIKSLKLIYDDSIDYRYKSTLRDGLDNLYGRKDEACDILIVKNNLLTDTSIANIALFIEGFWYTPKTPLLYGTTRDRLIDTQFLKVKDLKVEDISKATKVALMNAMIGFKEIEDITFL